MKTQQSVEKTVMQILAANLQLDMPHPVAARKKVAKEIIELFDQQTASLKLINEKQAELIEHLKWKINHGFEMFNDIWLQELKQLESELAAFELEPTAMEITAEMDNVISEFKKDFSGDDSYLSGVNDGMYFLYRKLVELK